MSAVHSHSPAHHTPPMHEPTDAWHDHAHDERPQTAHGEVSRPGLIIGIGVGLFLAVAAAVVVVQSFYKWYTGQQLSRTQVASGPNAPAIEARAFKASAIAGQQAAEPSWMVIPAQGETPAKAIAVLPVETASTLVMREYAARMGGTANAPDVAPAAPAPNTPAGGSSPR